MGGEGKSEVDAGVATIAAVQTFVRCVCLDAPTAETSSNVSMRTITLRLDDGAWDATSTTGQVTTGALEVAVMPTNEAPVIRPWRRVLTVCETLEIVDAKAVVSDGA